MMKNRCTSSSSTSSFVTVDLPEPMQSPSRLTVLHPFWKHIGWKKRKKLFHVSHVHVSGWRKYGSTSWWLNQPIWKICSSNWKSSPIFGVNISKKYLSCHHLYRYLEISWVIYFCSFAKSTLACNKAVNFVPLNHLLKTCFQDFISWRLEENTCHSFKISCK